MISLSLTNEVIDMKTCGLMEFGEAKGWIMLVSQKLTKELNNMIADANIYGTGIIELRDNRLAPTNLLFDEVVGAEQDESSVGFEDVIKAQEALNAAPCKSEQMYHNGAIISLKGCNS